MQILKCDNCGELGAQKTTFEKELEEKFPAFRFKILVEHISYDEHLCHNEVRQADLCYKCKKLFNFVITGPKRK